VANLNIEATYQAVTGQYAEFPSLCFVDSLDNIDGPGTKKGHQFDMFAAISDENVERVKRQNLRKVSVVIGNPPYNANQQNENDNNKNRDYDRAKTSRFGPLRKAAVRQRSEKSASQTFTSSAGSCR